MKAIANVMYYDHSKTYEAVAVVNRRACEKNEKISLMDFKSHKSCHGGYSTAAGWNYPINQIKNLINNEDLNDREIATSFFPCVCAPSEVEGFEGTINFKFPLMKINIVATMFGVRSSQIFEKENYEQLSIYFTMFGILFLK